MLVSKALVSKALIGSLQLILIAMFILNRNQFVGVVVESAHTLLSVYRYQDANPLLDYRCRKKVEVAGVLVCICVRMCMFARIVCVCAFVLRMRYCVCACVRV